MATTLEKKPDVRGQLAAYQKILDQEIDDYSERLLANISDEYTPYSQEAAEAYVAILRRGGKRLRGALTIAGYKMAGGEDDHLALKAGLVMELLHAYLLIIDDVADRSELRRGGPAAHKIIEAKHKKRGWKGDSAHFGEAVAAHAGLMGGQLATQELCNLPAPEGAKLKAVSLLNQIIGRTVHGQFNDLYNEAAGEADEQTVLETLRWKTAGYSITGPLQTGAILAGAAAEDTARLEPFGDNLGLAYQLTDDILGTFSETQETGKSNFDDMREGKITLMVARGLAHGNDAQKNAIKKALGNQSASDTEFNDFRAAITESGGLDYTREMAGSLTEQALASLEDLPPQWQKKDEYEFLRGLTRHIQTRTA